MSATAPELEIEVTRDPLVDDDSTLVGPEHEMIPDGEWIRWARRATGRDNLFVHRNRMTGNFVLGWWVVPRRSFVELACRPFRPDDRPRGWFASQAELQRRLRPMREVVEEMRREGMERHRRKREARAERVHERDEAVKYMKGRRMDSMAHVLEKGMVPYAGTTEGGTELAEAKDMLTTAAKVADR